MENCKKSGEIREKSGNFEVMISGNPEKCMVMSIVYTRVSNFHSYSSMRHSSCQKDKWNYPALNIPLDEDTIFLRL